MREALSILVFLLDPLKVDIFNNYRTLFFYPADFIVETTAPPEILSSPGTAFYSKAGAWY
jgi:hypothetical protein